MIVRGARPEISLDEIRLGESQEPLFEAIGLLEAVSENGTSLMARIDFGVDLCLRFNSKKEFEQARRILNRCLGRVVGIFSDDGGIPHIRLISPTAENSRQ